MGREKSWYATEVCGKNQSQSVLIICNTSLTHWIYWIYMWLRGTHNSHTNQGVKWCEPAWKGMEVWPTSTAVQIASQASLLLQSLPTASPPGWQWQEWHRLEVRVFESSRQGDSAVALTPGAMDMMGLIIRLTTSTNSFPSPFFVFAAAVCCQSSLTGCSVCASASSSGIVFLDRSSLVAVCFPESSIFLLLSYVTQRLWCLENSEL